MSLKILNNKKIFTDLKYWKDEISLKREMLDEMERLFSTALSEYLKENKDIKEKWESHNKKKEKEMEEMIKKESFHSDESIKEKDETIDEESNEDVDNDEIDTDIEEENKKVKVDPIYKKVYYEIVKKTHPDKVKYIKNLSEEEIETRKELYLEATNYYNDMLFNELLFIAFRLGIDFDMDSDKVNSLKEIVTNLKEQSEFIEKTFTWKWYNSDSDIKEQLLELFIKSEMQTIG